MDEISIFATLLLLILVGPWVAVWRVSIRRKRERAEDRQRWQDLVSRISAVERAVAVQEQRRNSATKDTTTKLPEHSAAPAFAPPPVFS